MGVNLIKNPDFVFDVEKTPATDLNLSIIAQTLMSSCLHNDPILNKESPSHKLLFARDIADYRAKTISFYEKIKRMPQVTDQDLDCYMQRLSQLHEGEFNQMAALKEIFLYVSQYYNELAVAFNDDVAGNGTLHGNGSLHGNSNNHFISSPTSSITYSGSNFTLPNQRLHMQQQVSNRDLSQKLEHIFKIVKESDYVR